jgi:hypothetical protein
VRRQKQLNELIEDLSKLQNETKETIKKDMCNKEDSKGYVRGVQKRYGKLQKNELNGNAGNKNFLK